jgi:hypothetical protein
VCLRAHAGSLPHFPLKDALQLVHLYAERGSPNYERAAMRWLERYLAEGSSRLQHFAESRETSRAGSPSPNNADSAP